MPLSSQPRVGDAALERRFRAGDASAFEEVVRQHRETVYRVARRILRTHEDADEAAQVAFIRAWRARSGFRGDAALRTWLTRIVLNVARSMLSRAPAVEALDPARPLADPSPGAEQAVLLERLRGRVRRAVGALPPRQREVVMLKVFSEMTYREVAAAMELSEGAVKAHLHQAVSNLRRRMAEPREPAKGSR